MLKAIVIGLHVLALSTTSSITGAEPTQSTRRLGKKETKCEEVKPLPPEEFDVDLYVEKSWYIQKQQINPYQGINRLYCVTATYNKRDDGLIQILNIANDGSVSGSQSQLNPDCIFSFSTLCGRNKNNGGGFFTVAPCLFQQIAPFTAGDYWVLALGDAYDGSGGYSWAIVIAGQPMEERVETDGRTFCSTPNEEGTVLFGTINLGPILEGNGAGLWLLSRNQVYNETEIAVQEEALTNMGIYTGDLEIVNHEGCSYPDFVKT